MALTMKNQELFNELLKKQLKTIPPDKKFRYSDLKRLCKYINTSIFDENICTMWNGYITNENNITKGVYINFYFNGTKSALHRLLYINFIGELSENEYLKFTCENKGKCCNIMHLKKFSYTKKKKIINSDNKIAEKVEEKKKIKPIAKPISFNLSFD
jgi:hypothetical protein